jgi:hypothetical protein
MADVELGTINEEGWQQCVPFYTFRVWDRRAHAKRATSEEG